MRIYRMVLTLLFSLLFTACTKEYWPTEPLDRSQYAEYDLAEKLERNQRRDEDAVDYWTRTGKPDLLAQVNFSDPIDVGLHFAGYPNLDRVPPDIVLVYYRSGIDVTVVVVGLNNMDDSIRDKEQRIDLHFEDGVWNVEWAGYRQRCYRTAVQQWTTELCP